MQQLGDTRADERGTDQVSTVQVDDYARALVEAVARVKAGATVVIDVHVAPEYARAVSSAVVRQIPGER